MENKICKYCNCVFVDVNGRWFSNHVRWCEKNPIIKTINVKAIKEGQQKHYIKTLGEIKEFEVNCFKCKKAFTIKEREKQHPKKDAYYCSRSCANSRNHSDETKQKTSNTLIAKTNNSLRPLKQKRNCLFCNKEFEVLPHVAKKFCCNKCSCQSRKSSTEYLDYKSKCQFKFNVYHFPDKFDLNLLKEHGWYQPVNKGNNLGGVSRDHMISVKYGWENGIDSSIMSHPANCKLMIHTENISKHKKCSLMLEELIERIKKWDEQLIV